MKAEMALVGNPNSGKTSLFNELTGDSRSVGNWAGVTVQLEKGRFYYQDQEVELIDLPGLYSLHTPSPEQRAVGEYLEKSVPDVLINVVDSTNLERNLYLTTQLAETGLPLVVALNMEDELKKQGVRLDAGALSSLLGVPCVQISATRRTGLERLLKTALNMALHPYLGRGEQLARLYAPELRQYMEQSRAGGFRDKTGDWERRLSAERYRVIGKILPQVTQASSYGKAGGLTERLDRLLCHRLWAFPLFILAMLLMLYISFGPLGSAMMRACADFIQGLLPAAMAGWLSRAGAGPLVSGLIVDGVIRGVGAVLVFLPQLMLLFFFLALLEASGYMARAAFITDKALARLGLSGMSFIPMMLGFGCSVPAMVSCRLLENQGQRRLTMLMIPFMSCSARMPVYALIASVFFDQHKWLVISCLYLLGVLAAILTARFLGPQVLGRERSFFIMEMPPYRKPAWHAVWQSVWLRSWDFISRAGSALLIASVAVWFLSNIGSGLHLAAGPEGSVLYRLGAWIAPLFAPLGFGYWQLAVALLTGFLYKEAVVSTLSVLYSSLTAAALPELLSPAGALAFLVFVLLYTPCIATLTTVRRESGSWPLTLWMLVYQIAVAWLLSFFSYRIILMFL